MRLKILFPFFVATLFHVKHAQAQDYLDAWAGGSSGVMDAIEINNQGHIVSLLRSSQATSFNGYTLPYLGHRYLISMTATGSVDWAQPVGALSSMTTSFVQDENDNIYFAGIFNATGHQIGDTVLIGTTSSTFISKFSPAGELLWLKPVGSGLLIRSIDRAPNGDLILGGITNGPTSVIGGDTIEVFGNQSSDIMLVKLDADGDLLWYDRSGGPGPYSDHCTNVVFDANDNIIMTGWFRSDAYFDTIFMPDLNGSNNNGFVASYSPSGDAQWVSRLGYEPSGLGADSLGNLYAAGFTYSLSEGPLISGSPNAQHYLAKLNGSGTIEWIVKPNDTNYGQPMDVSTDAAGNCWVVGHHHDSLSLGPFTKTAPGNSSLMVYKADANGTIEWMDLQGSTGSVTAFKPYAVAHNDECGLVISGSYNNSSPWTHGTTTLPPTTSSAPFIISMDDCGLTTTIQGNQSVEEVLLYPNPATNVLHVKGVDGGTQISIMDLLGRPVPVEIRRMSDSWELNVSNVLAGSYILRVQNDAGAVARKFQVQ